MEIGFPETELQDGHNQYYSADVGTQTATEPEECLDATTTSEHSSEGEAHSSLQTSDKEQDVPATKQRQEPVHTRKGPVLKRGERIVAKCDLCESVV